MGHPRAATAGRRSSVIALDLRYSLFALAYLTLISWFATRLEHAASGSVAAVRLAATLYHVPLYAGLGFFILQAISRGHGARQRWSRAALTFAATGALAAFEEWHQASVPPGWHPALGLLLDLAGVGGLLLVCILSTDHETRRG